MKIHKIINNNVVSAFDEKKREIVVMGRGIGFKAHIGDEIEDSRIAKIFRIENETLSKQFQEILENIPLEHMQITSEIISRAKEELNVRMNQSIYVTLTDHINFAIQRQKEGIQLKNALLWEIRQFYKKEYEVGKYAITLLNEKLRTNFEDDEAGFIALHFVNAEYNTGVSNTYAMTNMIQDILNVIREEMDEQYDEESIHYERFLTHLKFLAQRYYNHELLHDETAEITKALEGKYSKEYACSRKTAKFIEKKYGERLSEEEIMFLAIHIKRVFMKGE